MRGLVARTLTRRKGGIVAGPLDLLRRPLHDPRTALSHLLLGYLLGSIPFGLLLTRLAGKGDIREIGSGNIGATNVLRAGGKGLAAATLLLDCQRAAAVVLAGRFWPGTRDFARDRRDDRPSLSRLAAVRRRQGRRDLARHPDPLLPIAAVALRGRLARPCC